MSICPGFCVFYGIRSIVQHYLLDPYRITFQVLRHVFLNMIIDRKFLVVSRIYDRFHVLNNGLCRSECCGLSAIASPQPAGSWYIFCQIQKFLQWNIQPAQERQANLQQTYLAIIRLTCFVFFSNILLPLLAKSTNRYIYIVPYFISPAYHIFLLYFCYFMP